MVVLYQSYRNREIIYELSSANIYVDDDYIFKSISKIITDLLNTIKN